MFVVERFQVQSRSPFELHQILTRLEKTPETTVDCELYLPEGEGPFGCVIALHGSLGLYNHHQDPVGVVPPISTPLVPPSSKITSMVGSMLVLQFAKSTHSYRDQSILRLTINSSVTHAMMLVDAFRAREILEQNPKIGKIGISGWSLGGTVALYSAWNPIVEIGGTWESIRRSSLAHSILPAAHIRPDVKEWTESPKLILHGESDDWTPVHFVEGLLPQLPNAVLHVYPGSHHSFDCEEEFTRLPHAVHLKKRTIRIDKNGHMSGEIIPRPAIADEQTLATKMDYSNLTKPRCYCRRKPRSTC